MALEGIKRWSNRVALVTGASVGIGAEICRKFVQHGIIVVGCARDKDKIDDLAKEFKQLGYPGALHSYKCDLSKDNEIEEMFHWIIENHGGVDICVNNAAFAYKDSLMDITPAQMREMLDVNIVAVVSCTSKSVKSMRDRGVDDGHIFLINSMSGHRLTGVLNFYCSTKFAVTALTEGFRRELVQAKTHIRVTSVSPGIVHSEFLTRAFGNQEDVQAIYNRAPAVMESKDMADIVLFALSAPANVQVHDVLVRPTGDPN